MDALLIAPGVPESTAARLSEYNVRRLYYENKALYATLTRLGVWPLDMPAEWNPVPAVVDFYGSNTLDATAEIVPGQDATNPDALIAAIEQVRAWSNFQPLCRALAKTAALYSDAFIKVAEKRAGPDEPVTGVYLQDIQPYAVQWWEVDERDYLTAIRIDTPRLTSVFTGEERRHTLVEMWRKSWPDGGPAGVRYYEVTTGRLISDDQLSAPVRAITADELGYDFIPIVWTRAPTYWWGQTAQIDAYNRAAFKAARANRPLALARSEGIDANTGRERAAPLVRTESLAPTTNDAIDGTVGIVSVPGMADLEWMPPSIDMASEMARMATIRQGVISSLPEYRAATLDAVQVTTETLELLLNQAGQRVLEVRDGLERALERAQMMALSIAQLAGLPGFDMATIGTYEAGNLEHEYAQRGVFEKPSILRAQEAGQHINNGMGLEAAYTLAGYAPEQIEAALRTDTAGEEGLTQ
jgi:hypothetical protein